MAGEPPREPPQGGSDVLLHRLLIAFGDRDAGARAAAHSAFSVASRANPGAACFALSDYAAAQRQRASRSTGRMAADPGVLHALVSLTHALTDAVPSSVDPAARLALRRVATGACDTLICALRGSASLPRPEPPAVGHSEVVYATLSRLTPNVTASLLSHASAHPSGADCNTRRGA